MNNPYPDSSWRQVGSLVYKLEKHVFSKPISSRCSICVHLGAIKKRNDGRWDWWRFTSDFYPDWKVGQGVAATKMGAMYFVHEGLLPWHQMSKPYPMATVCDFSVDLQGDQGMDTHTLGRVIDTGTGVFPWVRDAVDAVPNWEPGHGQCESMASAWQKMSEGWKDST